MVWPHRTRAATAGRAPGVCYLAVLIAALCAPGVAADEMLATGTRLEVISDPEGGVRAHAILHLSAPMQTVHHLLTDFANWPMLFETKMRVAKVERLSDRVITELFIAHPILPGERRLVGDNRVLPGGGLSTKMIGGDFKRYERTWRLSENGATHTRAEFDLLVDADTLAPDWIVAMEVKRELEAHFRILRAKLSGAH